MDPTTTLRMSSIYRHPFLDRSDTYYGGGDRALLINERNMCALSATIRSKPSWWIKYQDPAIRAKWKAEAVGAAAPYGDIPLREDEVDYVLDELAWHEIRRDEDTGIEVSVFQRIWQSDKLIDESLREDLLKVVASLENIPEKEKDWHPRSNDQVLNLVHPSLFCIVYGRTVMHGGHTLAAPAADSGVYSAPRGVGVPDVFCSKQFCWLPTDFAISADGTSVESLGYINNISTSAHVPAYPVVEQLVARFVPLWERVLSESRSEDQLAQRVRNEIMYEWEDPLHTTPPLPSLNSDEYDKYWQEWMKHEGHILHLPQARTPFTPHAIPQPVNLKGRTLQVIVKLANIHLTPEKRRYPGGNWHVEAMANEAIISTGIYYYDETNVTDSSLAFRMAVDDPRNYEQHDEIGVKAAYGIPNDAPLNQALGAVVTKQGCCLAFPNVYQHQVQPFELADPTRPGHRKIAALFLVDPDLPTPRPSTRDVPPQQKDWMLALLLDTAAGLRTAGGAQGRGLGKLPVEVLQMIMNQADWLMSRQEAEEYRLALMDERTYMTEQNDELMFSPAFYMCEH